MIPRLECRRFAKHEGTWRNGGGLQARQLARDEQCYGGWRRVAKNEGKWRNVGGLQARQFVGVQTKTVCKGMSRVGVSKGWKK